MQTLTVRDVLHRLETTPELLRENWCVPREAGRFLYWLTQVTQAKSICEVGTSIGYSTLWLASGAQENGGRVDTLDYFEVRQNQARQHVEEAGLSSVVTFHQGAAIDLLTQFQSEGRQFDLAFVDAAKKEYIDYVRLLENMMPSGAVLVADNTRSHRDEMEDFLAYMDASSAFVVAEIETPNGQLVAYKR